MRLVFRFALTTGLLLLLGSCVFFRPSSEKLYRRSLQAQAHYDAIIVPGVPFWAPHWDATMQARVTWAVHLYKRGLCDYLIMSGSSVYSPYVEARIMKAYAIALGVPEARILVEDKAEHSVENLWYGNLLAKSRGLTTIAMASDPFQTKMLYRFVKKRLPDMKFLPILSDSLEQLPKETPLIQYDSLLVPNFIALPERESRRERFRGTMGKHIDFGK